MQALQKQLEARGKKLALDKAQGCVVQKKHKAKGQGLFAQDTTTDTVSVVQVPAGDNAALYLAESTSSQDSNAWVSVQQADDGGQWLTHLEVATENDTNGAPVQATDMAGANLFLPDDANTQDIAAQIQQSLGVIQSGSAQAAGLRAMDVSGLDWTNAQVIIVNADQDQATALIAVPPAATTTSGQMVVTGGGSFDPDTATYTAVKVQRQVNPATSRIRWQLLTGDDLPPVPIKLNPPPPKLPAPKPQPPAPPPPPPPPPLQVGSALNPTFELCPYQLEVPMGPFSKVACQGSWGRWYSKQWENNTVQDKVLQATGAATSLGAYPVTYAWDQQRGINLLAAGFDNLGRSDLQQMLDNVVSINQAVPLVQLPPDVLQSWNQSLALLKAIPLTQLTTWLMTLSQAMQQGTFDQVYNQFVIQGLGQLQQALMVLDASNDPANVKASIQNATRLWSMLAIVPFQLSPGTATAIDNLRKEVDSNLSLDFLALQELITKLPIKDEIQKILSQFGINLQDPWQLGDSLMAAWRAALVGFEAQQYTEDELLKFSQSIHDIVFNYGNFLDLDQDVLKTYTRTAGLLAFLDWVANPTDTQRSLTDRLEQGFGTLVAAGNLVDRGWQYKAMRTSTDGQGQ